jgi:hypothetical protein
MSANEPSELMISTKLFTRSGDYVTKVWVPMFKLLPEALQWGGRTFFFDQTSNQYREGFLYVVPAEVEAP